MGLFNTITNKKSVEEKKDNRDICGQLGRIGITLLGETLRQGMKIVDEYNENKYSFERLQLITGILDDVFECSKIDYMDVIHKLNDEKKGRESGNDVYIINSFINIVRREKGHEDCIRLRTELK